MQFVLFEKYDENLKLWWRRKHFSILKFLLIFISIHLIYLNWMIFILFNLFLFIHFFFNRIRASPYTFNIHCVTTNKKISRHAENFSISVKKLVIRCPWIFFFLQVLKNIFFLLLYYLVLSITYSKYRVPSDFSVKK